MIKYKLIKEYPGSPKLETVVEKNLRSETSYSYLPNNKISGLVSVLSSHVEDNPEYWEKVNDYIVYLVCTQDYYQDEFLYFKSWKIYKLETIDEKSTESMFIFKTKEEAEEFILYNYPYLSYNNIAGVLSSAQRDVIKIFIKNFDKLKSNED